MAAIPLQHFGQPAAKISRLEHAVDQLWAPWRLNYVATPKDAPPTAGPDCFICFCEKALPEQDPANLVVHRTAHSLVVLNRYPYNNGHLLVCPRRHQARLDELTPDELLDLQLVLQQLIQILQKRMNPDGFNVGLNLGRAAGAGVPGHLHWHLVPRWTGDTNFMPVLSDTRVIVQSLEALYILLREELLASQA